MMDDIVGVWSLFRDPKNGFWCDSLWISTDIVTPCGPDNNFYSSAGTGMGLVTEVIMAEIGYQTKSEARTRLVQSLTNLLTDWPRETFSGFLIHYTNRELGILSEFSTIDTTICVLGALFAGNYFGGEVQSLALQLRDATQWSNAIEAGNLPGIVATVDYNTGAFGGDIRPFNEYYLVAYIANLTSPAGSEANKYFERYMSTSGEPPGDGIYPYHKSYEGYDLLTDYPTIFMSSFIPQFSFYLARGYQNNQYYAELNTRWLKADKLWWSSILTDSSTIWGKPVLDRVWGAGAGPCPSGYCVDRIENSEDLIVSAAIMAGFLPNTDTEELRQEINSQLEWLYENDVCSYPVNLESGASYKVLWRCSVKKQAWECPSIDSIDFSTSILGYASNFLPENFYNNYAA